MAARRRAPLSKDRVLNAAQALADRDGIDALSMRRLAQELGYEVMSLYNHVANKEEILDALVERVAADLPSPHGGRDWKASVRESTIATHRAFTDHPWAADLWVSQRAGPARMDRSEALLRALRESGFSPLMAHYGYHALMLHLLGFSSQARHFPSGADGLSKAAARFVATLPEGGYPYVVEHMQLHVDGIEGDDFEFILDLILDGLERASRAERRAARRGD
jgi:AcrR family transcriptional regulator